MLKKSSKNTKKSSPTNGKLTLENDTHMEKIEKVWFEENKIFIETNKNKKYSIPIEVFPTLKDASAEERSDFYIWDEAQSIRWECLDEDIHISSFLKSTNSTHRIQSQSYSASFLN